MRILHVGTWVVPTEVVLAIEIVIAVCCVVAVFNILSNLYIKGNAAKLHSATLPLSARTGHQLARPERYIQGVYRISGFTESP